MSATEFLRRHGWKMGQDLWWHDRLPSAGHHIQSALLQQAQWLEAKAADYGHWIRKALPLLEKSEGLTVLAGTDIGIRMSRLLCEVP